MRHPHLVSCCLLALLVLAVAGCGPQSPEEQVAATRAQYTVKLESFTTEEPPSAMDEPMMDEAAAAGEAVAEAAGAAMAMAEEAAEEVEEMMEGEPEMVAETGPRTLDVVLHLLVRFGGDKALPGITVEVTQADPFGKEKEPTLHWVDTAGMAKSDVQQVDLKLEGVEYEDGDAFAVTLKESVPAEERSKYREFAAASSG